LLHRASELIRDAFQLDHVAVYLLDHYHQIALLYKQRGAGSARARARTIHEQHTPNCRDDLAANAYSIFRSNSDGTPCYELVLPLAVGIRTIGALDLTTCDPAGFIALDQSVLQTLAGQLSVAIENARTYSQEHQAADEMREIDRLRGQFLMRMSHQMATYLQHHSWAFSN